MKRYRVGVSLAISQGASIWNSGLNQNLAFLVMLLKQSPRVEKVYLLNGGPEEKLPAGIGFDLLDAPFVKPQDVTHDIDLVIEFGITLSVEWLRHVRALGGKVVTMFVGHVYSGQAEAPMFGKHTGTTFVQTPWNEVWTLPHHMKTSGPMLRTVTRVPVHAMPHIWSPVFLDRQVRELGERAVDFGFKPPALRRPWRLAIFEPNISVVKNCFIPMLACEQAYRSNRAAVQLMMVLNTFHMKEHPTFNAFARHLDLTRDGKASYEPRVAFPICMAEHKVDAVVAHQWECGLNYSYYDALHGGYPLIHNSPYLRDAGQGFFYPDFEASRGGDALLSAWEKEPAFWTDYKARAASYLAGLDPLAPHNVKAYGDRIADLMEAPR